MLIGGRLNIYFLPYIGIAGFLYLITAMLGKFTGSTLGAYIAKAEDTVKKNIGFVLYSQAGIALGLGAQLYFNLKETITGYEMGIKLINILASATLILLVIGPILLKYALGKAGEINTKRELVSGL